MLDNRKQVEELKHKGTALDTGIFIEQRGLTRHITIHMLKAIYKGRKWMDMSTHERKSFEDLLYISNVGIGNPRFHYI